MDELEHTQLDEEDAEAYLTRRAEEREREKQADRKREEKIRSFRWSGGM